MFSNLFGKRKLSEEKISNIFVNSIISTVENNFSDLASTIKQNSEFIKTPQFNNEDSDKFLMIVVAGNLKFLSRYFSNLEEEMLRAKIIAKLGIVFGLTYKEVVVIVDEFSGYITRVNYPSKNTIYGMSKAFFYKYSLGKYQDEYFAQLDAPSPILLKQLDDLMEKFLWDWTSFFDKFKLSIHERVS